MFLAVRCFLLADQFDASVDMSMFLGKSCQADGLRVIILAAGIMWFQNIEYIAMIAHADN